jgi:hypothetical protein
MNEIFKSMIEEHFYQNIFESLQNEIMDNYDQYDLALRANVVNEVLEASLDNIELLRILDIKQDAEEISFDILVSCDIEIGDYAYRETILESVCQWFKLSCSATLQNAALKNFTVDGIEAYNK